ncbi:MAG: hypothetical protein ACO4CZ_05710 [Planctomycetota bacterium]
MTRTRSTARGGEVSLDRGPMVVTILLLLVLGGQAREVREVAGVAAQAFSVAVLRSDEVESGVVVRRMGQLAAVEPACASVQVRPAPRSRSPRSHAWPPPRAPSLDA